MIKPQETQRPCRGKQNTETVYYIELEGRFRETGGKREGKGECLSRIYQKTPWRQALCKSPHQAEGCSN